jgi:hypothetical protein
MANNCTSFSIDTTGIISGVALLNVFMSPAIDCMGKCDYSKSPD